MAASLRSNPGRGHNARGPFPFRPETMKRQRTYYRVLHFPAPKNLDVIRVFRQTNGEWAWRIVASNGEPIAVAESSKRKSDAVKRALSRGRMYGLLVEEEGVR